MKNQKFFTRLLLKWNNQENKRMMPWKGEKDPYKVWLSEVILQQTRVEQGWSYYEKFIQKYPTIKSLAKAKDAEVFKLWEGLGYYSRCKNLLHTARIISEKYNGQFPQDYKSILNLKGIGSYTASAIVSFCFDLPYAVVDGNVLRLLSRFFGIKLPVDTAEGKNFFSAVAQECLDKKNPGEYNQAIMDFGATICKPLPSCNICPLREKCFAFKLKEMFAFPLKTKQMSKRERWFTYFIFAMGNKKFVRQRMQKDIWQNLHEFYLLETKNDPAWSEQKVKRWLGGKLDEGAFNLIQVIPAKQQVLTHQIIKGYFIVVEICALPGFLKTNKGAWLSDEETDTIAFPRFIHRYLSQKTAVPQLF
jgi:A/G-specific adenine glycosylase